MKKIIKTMAVMALWVSLGLAAAYILNNFVFLSAQVASGSMEGTIMAQNRVLGLRRPFIGGLRRGDIVVFASPLPDEFSKPFIKRIIALPGEEIAISGGIVSISGATLLESYATTLALPDFGPVSVPDGHFFVMGDNRNFSRDSREWGTICGDTIIGRIYLGFSPMPALIGGYVFQD